MEIRNMSRDELRALYRGPLHRDFPPAELRPLSSMETLLEQNRYLPLAAWEEGRPQAYALFVLIPGAALLDYLAVEPPLRGRGVGGAFLRVLAQRDFGAPCLLLEAESPAAAQSPAQLEERRRRLRFYRGCGCRETGVGSCVFGVDYDILALPLHGAPAPDDQAVADTMRRLYQTVISPLVNGDPQAFRKVCQVYART